MDTLIKLRKVHDSGEKYSYGIDLSTGEPEDMHKKAIIEPIRVKMQAIQSATEAAIMIIRIDDVITAKKGAPPSAGGAGGAGGMGGYGGY